MLAVDQAMTQGPQRCNEQTAGESGCPYRMNVPAQRTNGWRSRVPLPDERAQRTLRLSEWAEDTQLTAVVLAFLRAEGGERRSYKLRTYTPVDEINLGNSTSNTAEADNKEEKRSTEDNPTQP